MRPGDDEFRCAGLRFFGAISASVTHELKNTFAIVRELSGLLGDLAAAANETSVTVTGFSVSRAGDISERIGKQVARADAIVKRMNAFSHSVDRRRAALDLREVVTLLAGLCRRFADMAKVELETRLPEKEIPVETDGFVLLHALYLPLRRAIAGGGPGATVTIAAAPAADGAAVSIGGPRADAAAEEEGLLATLANLLGARREGDEGRFGLLLPARMPAREEESRE